MQDIMPLITFEQWKDKMETQANGEKGIPATGQVLELMHKWYEEYLKYAFPYQRDADLLVYQSRLKEEADWLGSTFDVRDYPVVKDHIASLRKEAGETGNDK
jgi:hypothetical protein